MSAKSVLLVSAATFVGTMALGHLYIARVETESPSREVTVDSRDYPVCEMEDCSDQPGQIGVWFDPDTGRPWLSLGNYSVPVDRSVPCTDYDAYAREMGDDDCDGVIAEGESGWHVLSAIPGDWARPWSTSH